MRIERIRLPLSHRINVDNYESVEVAVELEAVHTDPAGETLEQVRQKLHDEVYKLWKQEAILALKGVIARRRDTGKDYALAQAILQHFAAQG